MKTQLMIAGLMLVAWSALSPSSAAEPASLTPIYEAIEIKAATGPNIATLAPIYAACKACSCETGKACDCGDTCSCEDCADHKKSTRTVTKPAMKLLARADLPADDPPPRPELKDESPKIKTRLAVNDAAPTPINEVARVINLLPKPEVGFVDFGCGSEARWCIAAAEKWKGRVTGIEIDPVRAAAAREHISNLGLDKLITIVEGDARSADVQGDVAVVYLYPELLKQLKPRLEKFRAVASYQHYVPGLQMTKNGETWFYMKSQPVQMQIQTGARQAVWQGMTYSAPVCTSPNCSMCNSIRYQIGF